MKDPNLDRIYEELDTLLNDATPEQIRQMQNIYDTNAREYSKDMNPFYCEFKESYNIKITIAGGYNIQCMSLDNNSKDMRYYLCKNYQENGHALDIKSAA